MAQQGVLSVKLSELDNMLKRLPGWIQMAEDTSRTALQQEIGSLSETCRNMAASLDHNLENSRGEVAATLAGMYREIQKQIRTTKDELDNLTAHQSAEDAAEEKALLAEYALDFAVLASTRAVLLSMEAIEAQKSLTPEWEANPYEESRSA